MLLRGASTIQGKLELLCGLLCPIKMSVNVHIMVVCLILGLSYYCVHRPGFVVMMTLKTISMCVSLGQISSVALTLPLIASLISHFMCGVW